MYPFSKDQNELLLLPLNSLKTCFSQSLCNLRILYSVELSVPIIILCPLAFFNFHIFLNFHKKIQKRKGIHTHILLIFVFRQKF